MPTVLEVVWGIQGLRSEVTKMVEANEVDHEQSPQLDHEDR